MLKEIGPGFRLTLVFTILTGLLYPAVMTGISQLIFPKRANGSLVEVNGKGIEQLKYAIAENIQELRDQSGSGVESEAS